MNRHPLRPLPLPRRGRRKWNPSSPVMAGGSPLYNTALLSPKLVEVRENFDTLLESTLERCKKDDATKTRLEPLAAGIRAAKKFLGRRSVYFENTFVQLMRALSPVSGLRSDDPHFASILSWLTAQLQVFLKLVGMGHKVDSIAQELLRFCNRAPEVEEGWWGLNATMGAFPVMAVVWASFK